jgi:hypothetical protein
MGMHNRHNVLLCTLLLLSLSEPKATDLLWQGFDNVLQSDLIRKLFAYLAIPQLLRKLSAPGV